MTDRSHPTIDDFDQLRGALDMPVAPAPAFAERLRAELHRHTAAIAQVTPATPEQPSRQPAPARPDDRSPMPLHRHRSFFRPDAVLAAAILILVSLGVVIGLSRLNDSPQSISRDLGDGSSGQDGLPQSRDGNWGGGTGHTWAFSLPGFDTGNASITQGGENSSFATSQSIVSNGSLIVSSHPQPDGSFLLEAFTLTGNPRWQVPIGAMPGMAIDNDRLYLIQTSYTGAENPRPLTAISLETGEVLWTGPDLASTGKAPWGWSPIVANGVVYVANQRGGAYALDAETGAMLWEAPVADDAVPARADGSSETQTGGSIALGKDGLFVAGWTNTIRKLDPATGKVLATITLDPGMTNLDLALRDSTLIAKATVPDDGPGTSTLVAIDTGTTDIRWTKATPTRIDDNMVMLPDRVIVTRVDQGNVPTLNVDGYRLTDGELLSIPMPMIETSGASLSAIDGPKPLLLIASADYALTVVNVETGDVVATQEAPANPPEVRFRQLPVIRVGDVLVFVQPNGDWFRITP
ncbi:MAG: PQQ-binding-like beta-propeller repeat protein [Thermomicrobiales bacterium]